MPTALHAAQGHSGGCQLPVSWFRPREGRLPGQQKAGSQGQGVPCEAKDATMSAVSGPTPTRTRSASIALLPTGVMSVEVWLISLVDTGKFNRRGGVTPMCSVLSGVESKPLSTKSVTRTPAGSWRGGPMAARLADKLGGPMIAMRQELLRANPLLGLDEPSARFPSISHVVR